MEKIKPFTVTTTSGDVFVLHRPFLHRTDDFLFRLAATESKEQISVKVTPAQARELASALQEMAALVDAYIEEHGSWEDHWNSLSQKASKDAAPSKT